MIAETIGKPIATHRAFAASHPRDGAMVLFYVAAVWAGIAFGFGFGVLRHPSPLFVQVHAAVFVGWLVAFTAQVLFIRSRHPRWHRRLGMVMAAGTVLVVCTGVATAYLSHHLHAGTPLAFPQVLSVQVGNLFAFASLIAAGVWCRKDAAAHRRLMLLAMLQLSISGYVRWLSDALNGMVHFGNAGQDFGQTFFMMHFVNVLLVLGMGVYDLATRRRLHPVYVVAATWSIAWLAFPAWLMVTPAWLPMANRLLGL